MFFVQNAPIVSKYLGRLAAFSTSCTSRREEPKKQGTLANSDTSLALYGGINYEVIIVQPSSALAAHQPSQREV